MKTYQMYIDGQFVTSTSGQFFDVINPATEEVIASVTKGTVEETRAAIDAADKAQNAWEQLPAIERAGYLRKIAHGIRERTEEIARVISSEMGKTLPLARVEVNFTADYIDYMAEWARRYEGRFSKVIAQTSIFSFIKKQLGSPQAFFRGISLSF